MIVVKPGGRNVAHRANILILFSQRSPQWVCRLQEPGAAGWRPRRPSFSTASAALLRSHYTLHSRTFDSPSAYAGVLWVTQRPPRTHMVQSHRQLCYYSITFLPEINIIIIFFFFLRVMTCSHISVFPTQHQTSRMSAGRPAGCFYMVINWRLVRECVHLSPLRVKSTAWRVIH